jgi:hypothetical protein
MLPKRVKHMADFAWQVFFGSVGFLLFLGVALFLGYLVHWMESVRWVPEWLIAGAEGVEIFIFYADVFSFIGLVIYELYVFWSGLIASRNG